MKISKFWFKKLLIKKKSEFINRSNKNQIIKKKIFYSFNINYKQKILLIN